MKFNKLLIGLVPALAVSVTMACTKRPQSTAENSDRVGEMDSGTPSSTAENVGDSARDTMNRAGDAASSAGTAATDAARDAMTPGATDSGTTPSTADTGTPGTTGTDTDTTGTTGTTDTGTPSTADTGTPGTTGTDTDTTGTTGTTDTGTPSTADTGTTPPDTTADQPSAQPVAPEVVAISMVALDSGEVRSLQTALNSQGAKLQVDGIVGPQTTEALKKYQADHNLAGEGTLTADTLDQLGLSEIKQAH